MAQGPVRKLQSERARLERYGEDGTLPRETTEALLEWSSALHPDESETTYITPDGEAKTFAISTVQAYLRSMRKVAVRAIPDLCSLDPSEFNDAMDAMHTGENPHVKEGGLSRRTLAIAQSAARTFVWYFDIASPAEITVYSEQLQSGHDDGEVFSRRDVQALRQHVEGPRNRALLELLLNTGQRISAIQGLRIRDIDLEHGTFSLNTEREGLKGAARRVNRRPLLGAQPALADWLDAHPLAGDPEAYLFVGDPDHHFTKLDQPLCQGTIRRMLETTAERANVDKPVNPHSFRHFWTTTMKQDYGLNDEEIKLLLGHGRDGNGVNTVYNHSKVSELLSNVEEKLQGIDERSTKPLTPDCCGSCGEELDAHWQCCPVCRTSYGPSNLLP